MDKHPLQSIIEEELDVNSRSYSGRVRYGTNCLGVTIEQGGMGPFIADLIVAIAERSSSREGFDVHAVSQAFREMTTEQMGTGTIIYFPDVPYTEEEEDMTPAGLDDEVYREDFHPDPDERKPNAEPDRVCLSANRGGHMNGPR